MENVLRLFIIGLILFLYGMLNYYIGERGAQSFSRLVPNIRIYWFVFWVISLAYPAGRFGQKFLPAGISRTLTVAGAYWLAAMFYFILILLVIDLVKPLDNRFGFLPGILRNRGLAPAGGLIVLILVTGIVLYGYWNARMPQVRHYDLTIAKKAGSLQQLHVVMVSDIHLGTIVHNGRLIKLTDMINRLKPDLVLLPGDVIDEDIQIFEEQQMADTFRRLCTKYGVFAVQGNHEYISGYADEAMHYLKEAGVHVLRDDYRKVADCFYIVGRDDRIRERFGSGRRLELAALMQGIERSLPLILLDHQPFHLQEAQQQGVDLQLSGHTHAGQLFPIRLITRRLFETDWGYLWKGSLQIIVSSGFGTWGPPIRTGNRPEIVDIVIHFAKS